jgi:hypothetical protein
MGLIAFIAVAFSIPQASAHITSKTAHVLEHIYNFVDGIEERTANLPDDPADQSLLDAQLEIIKSDTDDIQSTLGSLSSGGGSGSKSLDVFLTSGSDPHETNLIRELLPYVPGKTYSGHINGHLTVGASNRVDISCAIGGERQVTPVASVFNDSLVDVEHKFSEDFACDDLRLSIETLFRSDTTSTVIATIQYLESTDLDEMTS